MEKNIILSESSQTSNVSYKHLVRTLLYPLYLLCNYYAKVLGKAISIRQTLLLLNAQVAFVTTVFLADLSFVTRIICCIWLLYAVVLCKRNF